MGWSVDNSISAELAAQEALKQALRAEEGADAVEDAVNTTKIIPKTAVANFAALATTYPTAQEGWEASTLDNDKFYRFTNGVWMFKGKYSTAGLTEVTAQLAEKAELINVAPERFAVVPNALNMFTSTVKIGGMSKDGRVFGTSVRGLYEFNETQNLWVEIYTFVNVPGGIFPLDNGEIMVAMRTDVLLPQELWISENGISSFKKVLEGTSPNSHFSASWGFSVKDNIVFISEYGSQGSAKGAYLSQDNGQTFTQVFDLMDYALDIPQAHVHGSAYDPYWNRLWIVTGDGSQNARIYWSDDLGVSWSVTQYPIVQMLSVIPLEKCILFGTDASPNGVFRMDRVSKDSMPKLKIAYKYNNIDALTHLPLTMKRRDEGYPVIIDFVPTDNSGTYTDAKSIATLDGYNFFEVFVPSKPIKSISGHLRTVFPTRGNKMLTSTDTDNESFVGQSPNIVQLDTVGESFESGLYEKVDDIYVNVRDFGVQGNITEPDLVTAETKSFAQAVDYVTKHNKILYVPKDMSIEISNIVISGKSNFGIHIEGSLKCKNGLNGLRLENCQNVNITSYRTNNTNLSAIIAESIGLHLKNCTNIQIGSLILNNWRIRGLVIENCDLVRIGDVYADSDSRGGNSVEIIDSSNVRVKKIYVKDVGGSTVSAGLLIKTTSAAAKVSNIAFDEIYIRNASSNSLFLDNSLKGILDNINLGNVLLEKTPSAATGLYASAINEASDVRGRIRVTGQIDATPKNIYALALRGAKNLDLDLNFSDVLYGIIHEGSIPIEDSKFRGKIKKTEKEALRFNNLNNVDFALEISDTTGAFHSVSLQYLGTFTNVKFDRCKFVKGSNVTGAMRFDGTLTNVIIQDSDFTSWGTEYAKMMNVPGGEATGIKRINNAGFNFRPSLGTALEKLYKGEIIYNTEPAAGGFIGWVCVTTGKSGTVKTFGVITA